MYLTDFEAAVIQMLQQASLNTPETNEKKLKGCKSTDKENLKFQNLKIQ